MQLSLLCTPTQPPTHHAHALIDEGLMRPGWCPAPAGLRPGRRCPTDGARPTCCALHGWRGPAPSGAALPSGRRRRAAAGAQGGECRGAPASFCARALACRTRRARAPPRTRLRVPSGSGTRPFLLPWSALPLPPYCVPHLTRIRYASCGQLAKPPHTRAPAHTRPPY
ncbi:MAG: hypothetical protein J3K34DRAFT_412037 [Monoraphidium minutum]|nr:MAG: hypothetical protein J3K34DRAFT_412037 [Monoraphidium minutum]